MLIGSRRRDKEEKLLQMLKSHCEVEEKLLKLFKNPQVDIEELINNINNLKNIRTESLKYMNIKEENEKIEEKIILVQDKELSVDLLNTYFVAKKEIMSIYEVMEKNTSVLNLGTIKNFLLEFSKLAKDEITIKDTNIEGIIVTLSDREEKIPLILKNGKKIIITSRNYDFAEFTYEELLEILRFFNIIINDNKYDHIREELVKHINEISSISPIKNS